MGWSGTEGSLHDFVAWLISTNFSWNFSCSNLGNVAQIYKENVINSTWNSGGEADKSQINHKPVVFQGFNFDWISSLAAYKYPIFFCICTILKLLHCQDKSCHLVVDPLACKQSVFKSEFTGKSPAIAQACPSKRSLGSYLSTLCHFYLKYQPTAQAVAFEVDSSLNQYHYPEN